MSEECDVNLAGEKKGSSSQPLNSSNERFVLRGWPLIEEWMTKLDEGMVRDFHEDINTLLTFAGLFSAVVTAFLIQLYLGLQPDSNQTTNNLLAQTTSLLGQISLQLANSSIIPVDIPTPSPAFQASGFTIWISTLWFLSLILSLAAALFGMISKQWLREYLQWTTMSGPSENQVALGQARYEAFMDWKTPAIISSMPVLLEIALIIFLLGLEGLLWTLDIVVFSICTVAIVTLIVMVIVVTVLPVFRARCPYKSPIGWAVVIVMSALFPLLNRVLHLAEFVMEFLGSRSFRASSRYLSVVDAKDWMEWDLARQRRNIIDVGWCEPGSEAALGRHWLLNRALWWIRKKSQDQRLIEAADEGFASRATTPTFNPFKVLAADVEFACEELGIRPTDIVPPERQCAETAAGECVVKSLFDIYSRDVLLWASLAPSGQSREHTLQVDAPLPVYAALAHMLTSDLLAVVAHYNEDEAECFRMQASYFLQAAYELAEFLTRQAIFHHMRPSVAVATDPFYELAVCLFRNHATNPPGLMPVLLRLPYSLPKCTRLSCSLTRLAMDAPRGWPDKWSKADCCIFAKISQSALFEWRRPHYHNYTASALLPRLLDRMSACVRRCLDQRWRDCGATSDSFSWPYKLRVLFGPDDGCSASSPGKHLPADLFPHGLVDALCRYKDAQLISGHCESENIRALVGRSLALKGQHPDTETDDGADDAQSSLESSSSGHYQPTVDVAPRLATLHPFMIADSVAMQDPVITAPEGLSPPPSLQVTSGSQDDTSAAQAGDTTCSQPRTIEYRGASSPGPESTLRE